MNSFTAVLDACVLFSASLRDLLLWLATNGVFRARWSQELLDEWTRNLLAKRPEVDPTRIERTCRLMNAAIMDAMVTGHESLIGGLQLPDADDRHVLAAAIRSGAAAIVTFNLKDFPAEALRPYGVEAIHPDDFLIQQIDLAPGLVAAAIKMHRASLQNPPKTVEDYIDTLERQQLPKAAIRLREFARLI
jgi:predicted nucleic acid-binding protein